MNRYAILKINSEAASLRHDNTIYIFRFGGVMNIIGRFISAISDPNVIQWLSDELGMIDIDRVNKLIQVATPPNEVVLLSLPQLISAVEGLRSQGLLRDEQYQQLQNFKKRLDPEDLNVLYDQSPSQEKRDMGDLAYKIYEDDPFGPEDAPKLSSKEEL